MSTKTISRQTYLQALALFSMSNKHYLRAQEFEREMARILDFEDGYASHLSDRLFDERPDFDATLARCDIAVAETDANDADT